MITYLACCVSAKVSGAEPKPPIRDTQSHEEVKNWIQKLSVAVMTLWSQDIISADVALTAKIPIFTYCECLLQFTAEQVTMMQTMAMVKPRNYDTDDVENVNDANNNNSQDHNASFVSESSDTAHHTSTMENAIDTGEQS